MILKYEAHFYKKLCWNWILIDGKGHTAIRYNEQKIMNVILEIKENLNLSKWV